MRDSIVKFRRKRPNLGKVRAGDEWEVVVLVVVADVETQPVEKPKEQWNTQETGTFGEDGWSISTSYKAMEKND